MTRESAGQAFKLLTAHYGTLLKLFTETDGATAEVYIRGLADLEPETLDLAVMQCITTGKFYPHPTVADIRGEAATLGGNHARTGAEAWGDVQRAVGECGYRRGFDLGNREPEFDDPLVAKIVAGLGWNEICMTEDVMPLRAQFIKAYEQLGERDRREAAMLPEIRSVIAGVVKRLELE